MEFVLLLQHAFYSLSQAVDRHRVQSIIQVHFVNVRNQRRILLLLLLWPKSETLFGQINLSNTLAVLNSFHFES